jgi:hypothetical protein
MTSPAPIRYRRLAILGAAAPHSSEVAYARAARSLGVTSRAFDVLFWHRRLRALAPALMERWIEAFDPDFILCTRDAQRLGAERLNRLFRGRTTAMWHVDIAPQPGVIELARRCGTLYLTCAPQRQTYRAAGVPVVRFMPQAMDRHRDVPAAITRDDFRCEVSFVGSGPYPYRWPLLQAVAERFDLQIRGPGWREGPAGLPVRGKSVHGREFAQVVRGAAVCLGASAVSDHELQYASASNRMWKIFGCGGGYVGPYIAGIEQFAQQDLHCGWFRSIGDALDQIAALVADPDRRSAMAERGRIHALAHHTYEHRMGMLLRDQEYPLQ